MLQLKETRGGSAPEDSEVNTHSISKQQNITVIILFQHTQGIQTGSWSINVLVSINGKI